MQLEKDILVEGFDLVTCWGCSTCLHHITLKWPLDLIFTRMFDLLLLLIVLVLFFSHSRLRSDKFIDWHIIAGFPSVIITTQLDPGAVGHRPLATVMTYDKGGVWDVLPAPSTDYKGKATNCEQVLCLCVCVCVRVRARACVRLECVPVSRITSFPGVRLYSA